MNKSIEYYLNILYPNQNSLSEEDQKKFEKDKDFLLEHLNAFNKTYDKYSININEFGEFKFTSTILKMCKERLDKETIITNYAQTMFEMLEQNSYISNDFDSFMDVMYFERSQEECFKQHDVDKTPIELEKVFSLTEEFLSEIDESQELVTEFINLKSQGKIQVLSPNDKDARSIYASGNINYVFDGTVNSAHTLLHEFMHHWVEIKGHPSNDREEHTMFNEYESIYYENAFIQFMNNKGLLKNGEEPVKASRLKRHHDEDPNNCVLMLLDLCKELKHKGSIDRDNIIDILGKYMPNKSNRDEIWKKGSEILSQYCKENVFEGETVDGPVMYRFNTGLAMQTNLDSETIRNIYKLAPHIKDRSHDNMFMKQYMTMTNNIDKTVSNEPSEDSIDQKIKEVEDKYKSTLHKKTVELYSKQHELISHIHELGRYLDLESDLPNIGITLNNKITELQHEFKNAGISMYAHEFKEYEFVGTSFMGEAIIHDLIKYVEKGTQNLSNYNESIKEITNKKIEKTQGLEKANPVRRFFGKIKNFFIPVKQEDMTYTKEETDSINSYLLDYKKTDEQLWKYNLRDNIVPSIVREIREKGYRPYLVPGVLEESVIPDLQKLGLADLIPQLQQSLVEEYKKDLPDPKIYKVDEKDMHLFVPDFNETKQNSSKVAYFEEISKQSEGSISNGVSLSDFAVIDKTVDASARHLATSAIKEELHPVLESNQDKKQETGDVSLD